MARPAGEKLLSEVIYGRRATPHFQATLVPDEDLGQILRAGLEAPSGFNLQPWRFVVVRDLAQRKRLRTAANNQPKVEEAPVLIVACGDTEGWRAGDLQEALCISRESGWDRGPERPEKVRGMLEHFLGHPGEAGGVWPNIAVWVNRQVMLAFTTMMWVSEVMGYDTAPMEGFQENKVREALGIPKHVRVVALLAIGHRQGEDKPYEGRFPMSRTVFAEQWGQQIDL